MHGVMQYVIIKPSDYDKLDEDMAERMSAMRMPGESDMDYYERRYLERVCTVAGIESCCSTFIPGSLADGT